MSTEANDDLYLGFDISEDLSDVGIEAWNYVSPSLEPIAESLYGTVTANVNTNVVFDFRTLEG
ncbi:hypothetical protein LTR37_018814 [Vermiconidia calcicola]|uniref:Uncharacterized protein n=1 Tax=Vermiconidia calcicola TaxID=1690605 RepID=A0ACC3MG13_9PEZI|nr:hypothetical protein LTR37_018814 [Vermiconidia calcicola]